MKLTGESKFLIGILLFTVVVVGIASVLLTKPAPTLTRADLMPVSAHTKGNDQAKTYLVEFSDFQCPACLAAKPVIDDIVKQYKDQLVFAYRYFPLDQHQFGIKSAIIAEAAGAQGKFWEMYDYLFANQDKFSEEFFSKILDAEPFTQMDKTKFANDLANPATKSRVLDDQTAGNNFGINATPTFFLNGKKIDLVSFSDLKTAVGQAIK